MRYKKTFWRLLTCLMVIFWVSPVLGQMDPQWEHLRNRHSAIILIKGNESLLPSEEMMQDLFWNSDRFQDPARKGGYQVHFRPYSRTEAGWYCKVEWNQRGDDTEETRQKTLKDITGRLQEFLTKFADPQLDEISSQLKTVEKRAKVAYNVFQSSHNEQRAMRCYLMELGGGISPDGTNQQYRELRNQEMMFTVERTGLEARRGAILEHIRSQSKRVEEELKNVGLEAERYAKTLDVYEKGYLRLLEANERMPGSVSQYEIELARSKWEQYKIETERDLRNLKKEIQERHLAGLPQQLMDVDIELKSVEAKLKKVDEMLEPFDPKKLLDASQMLEESSFRLEMARDERNSAIREWDELKRLRAECKPPKVIVIDEMRVEEKEEAKGAEKEGKREDK